MSQGLIEEMMEFTVLMFWNWYASVQNMMSEVITNNMSHNNVS